MSDYTPTAQELIAAWIEAHQVPAAGGKIDAEARPKERIAEAKRGIAAIEREAAARALSEVADALNRPSEGAGYEVWASGAGDWLRARAAEYRKAVQ